MPHLTRREAMRLTAAAATGLVAAPRVDTAHAQPPIAHADPRIRTTKVDLPSGVRLNVAEIGEADKPVILCLHGFTDSWRSFEPVMPLLAKSHRIIAIDMRGHGDSDTPSSDFTFDSYADDIVACVSMLKVSRATVIGHSLGSFIARRVATHSPERVQRLLLVGAGLTLDNEAVRGLQAEVNAQGDSISRELIEAFQSSTVLDRRLVPEWFFETCVNASSKVDARVWRETIAAMLNDQHLTRDVHFTCPTLIIGGEHDGVFPIAEQRRLANAISGSTLKLYRHCGHAPNWEQPQRFAEDVQDFLSR